MCRKLTALMLGAIAATALAQPAAALHEDAKAAPPRQADGATATAPTTLGRVQALRADTEHVDPFAPRPNRMAGRFRHDPAPEEITLRHNGYLMYYGTMGLAAGGRALNKVTGGPDQIQSAIARDVPLDEEQMARAARWSAQEH